MRTACIRISCAAIYLLSSVGIAAAAPFVNLDFEQSTVQPGDPTVVPTAAAFPGWTARFGGEASATVFHNHGGAGEPVVSVYDRSDSGGTGFLQLQGRFRAYLCPSTLGIPTSLEQVGDVPTGTRSLTLLCDGEAGPPLVSMNGSLIPMQYISGLQAAGETNVYGADITSFAGSTVDLRFISGPRNELHIGRRSFDDIRFSPNPIPEPQMASVALLVVCGLLVNREVFSTAARRRRTTHRLAPA